MTLRRQPTRFTSKCRYFAKHFTNIITKMPLPSHSTTKFFKFSTKFRLIKSSLNGSKIQPFLQYFYFSFCKNFMVEIKNSLRAKKPTNSPFILQSCPIDIRLSTVIEVLVEDPPSLILLISLLFSLI